MVSAARRPCTSRAGAAVVVSASRSANSAFSAQEPRWAPWDPPHYVIREPLALNVLCIGCMSNVAEIMTRKVLTVAAEAEVDDAAWGLTLKGVSGAPVKDDQGNIIGVISKSDLVDPDKRGSEVNKPVTARDVMTPVLFATRASDSVRFAARRMVETGAHRLVVVDVKGQLVGIVTPMDILRALVEGKIDVRDFDAI